MARTIDDDPRHSRRTITGSASPQTVVTAFQISERGDSTPRAPHTGRLIIAYRLSSISSFLTLSRVPRMYGIQRLVLQGLEALSTDRPTDRRGQRPRALGSLEYVPHTSFWAGLRNLGLGT